MEAAGVADWASVSQGAINLARGQGRDSLRTTTPIAATHPWVSARVWLCRKGSNGPKPLYISHTYLGDVAS